MIRDQIVEHTANAKIREHLLLEDKLTLKKALTILAQMESAVAEAKAVATSAVTAEAMVGMVRSTFFEVEGSKNTHKNMHRDSDRL